MGRDFLYYLVREDGRFCVAKDGYVELTTTPTPLEYTPDRWLDIEVTRQRNSKYFGVERSFTAPLDFVKDGGFILKYFLYNKGIEDKLYLLIAEKRLYIEDGGLVAHEQSGYINTETTGAVELETIPGYFYYYSAIYKGEIDFSQFKHAGPKVTLNIMEGGAVKLLNANQNTRVEIPMDDFIWVKFDGIYLHEKKNMLIPGKNDDPESFHVGAAGNHLIGISTIDTEGKAPGIVSYDVFVNSEDVDFTTSADYFLAATQAVKNVNISGTIKFDMSNILTPHADIFIKSNTGRSLLIGTTTTPGLNEIAIDYTFDTVANENYFLYIESLPNGFSYYETRITVSFRSRYKETYVKCYRPFKVWRALAVKAGMSIKDSSVLMSTYKDVVVTCGDALRGFANPVIKTTLADFNQSYNSIGCIGMAVEQNSLVCEKKSTLVNYSNPVELGECKDLKVSPATEYTFNTIKIGFPEVSYEDKIINGRYEFIGTHIYSTPITRVTKELDLVSVYRADSIGMEYTRINFEGKTTSDSDSDNDVFVVKIMSKPFTHPDGFTYFNLDRSLNAYSTGLLEPESVFNLWLSPKQCLLRNGAYIRSCFYKMDHLKITFQSTGKSKDLVVSAPGFDTVAEGADVEISKLAAPLFYPMILEFENKVPRDILDVLKSNTRRSFSFTVDGVTYVGLPLKDSVKPASRDAQTYQLLSSPDNDLTQLVDYDG